MLALCFLTVPGRGGGFHRGFHRGFPLLSQSLAAATYPPNDAVHVNDEKYENNLTSAGGGFSSTVVLRLFYGCS